MVSFFKRGDSGKVVADDSAEDKRVLSEREVKLVCVAATVVLVLLALLSLALSGSGSPVDRCKGILIQSQKSLCFLELAGGTENALLCNSIASQDQRYSCLVNIAEVKDNISICNEVNGTSAYYPQCVLNVSMGTGDASYCQLLNYTDQSSCVFGLAKTGKFGSMALCSSIRNKSVENECAYLHYYSGALKSGSAANCSFLPNETNYTLMALMLSSNLTSNTNGMESSYAALNTSPRNFCHYYVSILTGNSMGCSQVSGMLNDACTGAFMQSNSTMNITNVTAFCATATSQYSGLNDLCIGGLYTSEAIGDMNISKCMQIPSAQYVYDCITSYATKYADASYCSRIMNNTVEQQCYISVTNSTA